MREPMIEKQTNRERIQEITAGIEQGIRDLFDSEKYRQYLTTMSRFHTYSTNNTILIHTQRPNATRVAGYQQWKQKFGRTVKRGEKGIMIIAPMMVWKKIEETKRDPDTDLPILDKDGNMVVEEKKVQVPAFKPAFVFDLAQTVGKPLPTLASDLTGDVQQYDVFLEALRRTSPVPIEFKPIPQNMDGFFSFEAQSITIREGMSELQTVSAIVHEIAHATLHNNDAPDRDRQREELEAESISYSVCKFYNLETGENSFGYLASWSKGRELSELKAALETVNKTSSALITDIDRHFAEICKERGIDRTVYLDTEPEIPEPETSSMECAVERQDTEEIPEPEAPSMESAAGRQDTEEIPEPEAPSMECAVERQDAEEIPEPEAPSMESAAEQAQEPATESKPQQALDSYPMPDPQLTTEDMQSFGYLDENMLPLSKDRAIELLEQDAAIYMLHRDNTEEMAFDAEDILAHEGYFGIERMEWEKSAVFSAQVMGRLSRQEEREAAFLAHDGDCFAIYQLKQGDEQRFLRYEPLENLRAAGESPTKGNYDLVYTAPLEYPGNMDKCLDILWERFNAAHPADYQSPSMSVSDIVAVRQNGVLSCHYVDRFGFTELPGFFSGKNMLRSLEDSMEQNDNMLDGVVNNTAPAVAELEEQVRAGQQISLLDLANATHREQDQKKPSVLEKIKRKPPKKDVKTAPPKSAGKERE